MMFSTVMDTGASMERLRAARKTSARLSQCIVFDGGTTFPCIYALLPDERQDTYNAIWSNLKSDVKSPVSVMMDFEMASINSVEDNFPETEIKGCFFSFSQAIYRKILELGYAVQYRENKDFTLSIRLLAAL